MRMNELLENKPTMEDICVWNLSFEDDQVVDVNSSCGKNFIFEKTSFWTECNVPFSFCPACRRNIKTISDRHQYIPVSEHLLTHKRFSLALSNFLYAEQSRSPLSWKDLAKTTGISYQSLVNFRRAQAIPSALYLFKLAEALHVSVYDIFLYAPTEDGDQDE